MYEHTSHPSNIKLDPLYGCYQFIANDLEWTKSGSLKLIHVSNRLKNNLRIGYYFKALCWMNERYARIRYIHSLRMMISSSERHDNPLHSHVGCPI